MMPGTEHDVDDLVWHGRALCRALHRAWEAEVEAAELRASLDHCLAMGAKSHEQIVELCRLLDEARADGARAMRAACEGRLRARAADEYGPAAAGLRMAAVELSTMGDDATVAAAIREAEAERGGR